MELRHRNLVLREPVDDDAQAVAAAVQRSLDELRPWMQWADENYDAAAATLWIRGELGPEHRFVMTDPAGEIIGGCGLNDIDTANKRANLGYWVRSDRTRRGHAAAAATLLARFGLSTAGLDRLEIIMATGNEPSRRVAERIGARYEGRARRRLIVKGTTHDAYVYSVIEGDLG